MNGLLTLFIVSVIAQAGEILPEPNRTGASIPVSSPVSAPVYPSVSAPVSPTVATVSSCTVGWGKDPDGVFCMIMQISPEAIATFAQGEKGQELPVDIPPEIRQQIQRVIVRVGTGPVEKNPPNPQLMSSARDPTNTVPFVANAYSQTTVDNRSPVSIDMPPRSTEVLPTGGGGQLGLHQLGNPPTAHFGSDPNSGHDALGKYANFNQGSNQGSNQGGFGNEPTTNGPLTNGLSTNGPMTNGLSTNGLSTNGPLTNGLSTNGLSTNGLSTNGLRGNASFPSSMNNANEVMPNTTGATQHYNSNDGFQPAARTSTNFLRGAAGTGSGIGFGTSGNSYQPSSGTHNPSNPSNPNPNQYATGTNYQPNSSAFNNRGTIPRVATNPASSPLNYNEGNSIVPSPWQSGFQTNPSPSLSQMQQPTQSQPPTPNQYASAPYYSNASVAPWGSPPLPRQPQQPPLGTDPAILEPAPKDKLVPFLLLFSIVGNVYLGLWMGHVRSKYRQLLSNMRGVPISDLDA